MTLVARVARFAAAAGLVAAAGAQAGGPLSICSDKNPIAYSPPSVALNYDQGNLGARTKAQADAIVTNAASLWTNVPTATISLTRGADLPVDVTSANYSTYLRNYFDSYNPVVYDTDGSITDLLLGSNARLSVLGFAGSAYFTTPPCRFVQGEAVINGYLGVSDATMTVVLAHEIGHLIGLDHTQLDGTQGLAQGNYPLMYPIAYRNTATLGDDDVSAVTALYPDTNVGTVYGQMSGTFGLADNVTAVPGANIWAREVTSGKVYSVVSDYLTQGTGYFRLLLPAGNYTLSAEAIQSGFTGGSSVGPYSENSSGLSFQAPLYVGGAPMTPVTLGGGSMPPIPVTPGCSATIQFRIDEAGSIRGNCMNQQIAPSVVVTSSPNPSTNGQSVTFTATVSGYAGMPTGTVDFRDSASSTSICSWVALSSTGIATCSTTTLTVATHAITATYSGNATYSGAISNEVSQVVYFPASTSANVALASVGAVATASSQRAGNPASAVNNGERTGAGGAYWVDNTPGAFPDFVQVAFNGTHTIDKVVVYSLQDAYWSPIEPNDATTFSIYGLSAFTVEGWNGSAWSTLATVTGNTLVKRAVTFPAFAADRIRVNATAAASYSIIVEIEAFTSTASAPPLAAPTVTLAGTPNPSTSGQSVTFTATVSGSSGTPTGTVSFYDGGLAILGCFGVPLASGSATCSTAALTAATHSIAAVYSGNATYSMATSNTFSQVVNVAPLLATPAVAVTGTPNPSTSGQSVTFTATVSGSSGTPTGTVAFRDGGLVILGCASVPLASGNATCSTAALTVATHAITAAYSGNTTYSSATSNAFSQVVNAAPATGGVNVALASAGAVASASSQRAGNPVSAVNNGERTGAGGAYWVDNTPGAFPDFVQVAFNGTQTIDRVVVYSLQDAYWSPIEPNDATTFSIYGLSAFTVEGWNGSAWVNLATVTGNTLVKRTVTFGAFTTDRIRVNATAAASYSIIVEIEAWGS